uniref:Uncharacterized protein n=1 Tax=Anguilla anguilla TaxID=7936 RepID=A0A0E9S527_ANGAN
MYKSDLFAVSPHGSSL